MFCIHKIRLQHQNVGFTLRKWCLTTKRNLTSIENWAFNMFQHMWRSERIDMPSCNLVNPCLLMTYLLKCWLDTAVSVCGGVYFVHVNLAGGSNPVRKIWVKCRSQSCRHREHGTNPSIGGTSKKPISPPKLGDCNPTMGYVEGLHVLE